MVIRCNCHNSGSHSDDENYHQKKDGKRKICSTADSKNTNVETFIADSTVTGCKKKLCFCNCKMETISTENDGESYTLPGKELSFAASHLPLLQQADGFQLVVNLGSSEHLIDLELICGFGLKMLEYKLQAIAFVRYCTGYSTGLSLGRRYGRCFKKSRTAGSTCAGAEEESVFKCSSSTKRCQNCHH